MRNTKEMLKAAGLPNDAALDLAIHLNNIHATFCRLDDANRRALLQNLPELLTLAERFGRAEGLNADLAPALVAYQVKGDYIEAIQ